MCRRLWPVLTFLHFIFFFALLYRCHAQAGVINVTIDDTKGDENTGALPLYLPVGDWTPEPGCTQCVVKPDPTQAFDQTWHDTSHFPTDPDQLSIQVNFTGVAVYAFFIIANNVPNASTLTNMTFFLDGDLAGTFLHLPTNAAEYEYNVTGFSRTDLQNTEHQLIIQTAGTTNTSLVLFDYVIYSVPSNIVSSITSSSTSSTSRSTASTTIAPSNSDVSSPKHNNTAAIAGGVVGGIVGLLLILSAGLFYLRRRKIVESPPVDDRRYAIQPFSQKHELFTLDSPPPTQVQTLGIAVPTPIADPAGTKFSSYNIQADAYGRATTTSSQSLNSPSATRVSYVHSEDRMIQREEHLRPSGAGAPFVPSDPGVSQLRGEVVAIQAELQNLRQNQEQLRMNVEAPPRYDN